MQMPSFSRCCRAAFVLLVAPGALDAHAQSPMGRGFSIGAGTGITQSARISGQAYHATAGVELPVLHPLRLTAEALVQHGEVSGTPFDCDVYVSVPCLGRTDRNRIAGVGIQAKPFLVMNRSAGLHVVGGGGIYRRWTRSTEAAFPAGGTEPQVDTRTAVRTAFGYTFGTGLTWLRRGVQPYAELQATILMEGDESMAGALPLTFGVRF